MTVGYLGASHSLTINDMAASVPAPASQSVANHRRRCASRRLSGFEAINDSRFRV
jgi:hypothetical protein